METVGAPPADDAELHLLTEWGDRNSGSRTQRAAIGSVLVHVAVIAILALLPPSTPRGLPEAPAVHRIITPLIEPLTELTQKAPNHGKITKEFNTAQVEARPQIHVPAAVPAASKTKAPKTLPVPAVAAPKAVPAPTIPEPPKVTAAVKEPPKTVVPTPPAPPAPQIQAENPPEKPKIAFEAPPVATQVPAGQSRIPVSNNPVADAMRQAIHGNVSGGAAPGDQNSPGQGGVGPGISLPPSPGSQESPLQLLSDPMGVDFRPYLARVLMSVKQHWLAVIPESVRLGRRGKVAIQFSIDRTGQVPKLVIASASGAEALDRAAIAGVSASVPFPPLPAEFKGDKIVLQFNFAYNSK